MALATYIRAERYDFATLAELLAGQKRAAHAKWIDCWSRVEVMDMEGFPLWEEELHNLLMHAPPSPLLRTTASTICPCHHHCTIVLLLCDAASLR